MTHATRGEYIARLCLRRDEAAMQLRHATHRHTTPTKYLHHYWDISTLYIPKDSLLFSCSLRVLSSLFSVSFTSSVLRCNLHSGAAVDLTRNSILVNIIFCTKRYNYKSGSRHKYRYYKQTNSHLSSNNSVILYSPVVCQGKSIVVLSMQ